LTRASASHSDSRTEFLKYLDRFYFAIEHAAASIADFLAVAPKGV